MKGELKDTSEQIKKFKQQTKKNSEFSKLGENDFIPLKELQQNEKRLNSEISKVQKEIHKAKSKSLLIMEISILPLVFLLVISTGAGDFLFNFDGQNDGSSEFKTKHLIENLKGDTVDTWKSWKLVGTTMNVNIVNAKGIPDEKVDVIKNAIASEEVIEIDDWLTGKGFRGESSEYYVGWAGALNKIENNTTFQVPKKFNIIESSTGEGDVIITLSNLKDTDGYTGYTKSIVENNEILKSFITIYNTSNLTDEQLSTIVRHEFGHALGLGHSTATEDLMAPTIDMTFPYVSECNVAAINDLYNGREGTHTVCEK